MLFSLAANSTGNGVEPLTRKHLSPVTAAAPAAGQRSVTAGRNRVETVENVHLLPVLRESSIAAGKGITALLYIILRTSKDQDNGNHPFTTNEKRTERLNFQGESHGRARPAHQGNGTYPRCQSDYLRQSSAAGPSCSKGSQHHSDSSKQ